jgi:hypothetical protein
MQAASHNLLESCWFDGKTGTVSSFHYDQLKLDNGSTYRVDFTREVTPTGINVDIVSTTPVADATDAAALDQIIDELNGVPRDGFECQTLGWTYLGNITTNPSIQNIVDEAAAAGTPFVSILYHCGYNVCGCAVTKRFYDKTT